MRQIREEDLFIDTKIGVYGCIAVAFMGGFLVGGLVMFWAAYPFLN
jgi:hypothetical protein